MIANMKRPTTPLSLPNTTHIKSDGRKLRGHHGLWVGGSRLNHKLFLLLQKSWIEHSREANFSYRRWACCAVSGQRKTL
jgi:hypothetical protein